jgi:hypothetical protein
MGEKDTTLGVFHLAEVGFGGFLGAVIGHDHGFGGPVLVGEQDAPADLRIYRPTTR